MQELVTIDTDKANLDLLGYDVAISGDSEVMAVGAPYGDPNSLHNAGFVRLYNKDGTDWNLFQQLNGPTSSSFFGWSVDLSDDGMTLAVGSYKGAVRLYELSSSSSSYALLHTTDDIDACEVSVSGNGSVVGVTSTSSSNGASVYARFGNSFKQQGSTFPNYGSSSGIALNYNATIVIIGDTYWSSGRGRAGVFMWKHDSGDGSMGWTQLGSDIIGDAANDHLGYIGCVSITHDGSTVAIGAHGYDGDGNDKGLVRVYNYAKMQDMWKERPDIIGDNSYDRLSKTSLSSDGKYLVVGTSWGGSYLKIFQKNENNYEIIGEKVISGEGGDFITSVDMSAGRATVASGAYSIFDANGRAYLLVGNDPTHTPSFVSTIMPSAILSTSPTFVPSAAATKMDFPITFLNDETIVNFDGTSPDNEIIVKTLIANKAPRESFEQTIFVGNNCQFKLVYEYPDDTTLVGISNNENLDVVEGKHIKVTSEINIDMAHITSKGIHATDPSNKSIYSEYKEGSKDMAKIEFCIRTDYGKDVIIDNYGRTVESSVNFNEVKVTVTFLLQIDLHLAIVSIAEAEKGKVEQVSTITTVLDACNCPAAATSMNDCFDIPVNYDQNDILSICVFDPTENAFITGLRDVTLGNGLISTQVIDSDGKPSSLASTSKANEGMAVVNTRILSVFFDGDTSPAPVTVSGTAAIGFNTAATVKLTTVGMKGGRVMRKLQDSVGAKIENEGTFGVKILLSDSEKAGGSPSFHALKHLTMSLLVSMLVMIYIHLF